MQSLLFIQVIPEINYNHIEVSIVMRIHHGNEVAVCGPVTLALESVPRVLAPLFHKKVSVIFSTRKARRCSKHLVKQSF